MVGPELPDPSAFGRFFIPQTKAPMATNPMDMMAPEAQDAAPEETGGYSIEIKVGADGSITVAQESGEMEAAEHENVEAPEGQPAKDIKEALKMVLAIYNGNGTAQPATSEQDAAQSAFQSARGQA